MVGVLVAPYGVILDSYPDAELLRLWVRPASGEPWWAWPPDMRAWHGELVSSMRDKSGGHVAGTLHAES